MFCAVFCKQSFCHDGWDAIMQCCCPQKIKLAFFMLPFIEWNGAIDCLYIQACKIFSKDMTLYCCVRYGRILYLTENTTLYTLEVSKFITSNLYYSKEDLRNWWPERLVSGQHLYHFLKLKKLNWKFGHISVKNSLYTWLKFCLQQAHSRNNVLKNKFDSWTWHILMFAPLCGRCK